MSGDRIWGLEMKEVGEVEEVRCLDPQLWHACAGGMVQILVVVIQMYLVFS